MVQRGLSEKRGPEKRGRIYLTQFCFFGGPFFWPPFAKYRLSWSAMMKQLEFEKVGDVNSFFPYLCVYFKGESEPFMDIGISEKGVIEFNFYTSKNNVVINMHQWGELSERAQIFLKAELQNKEFE
jgi:hypothetical protein